MLTQLPCDRDSASARRSRSSLDLGLGSGLDALMTRHEGLVHTVLRRQWGGTLSYDERLQAGRIALWHALLRFDPNRGVAFSTYAGVAIQREIWHAVRQSKKPVSRPALPVDLTEQREPDAALLHTETLRTLHALVEELPSSLRQVVVAYYGLEGGSPRSLRQLGVLLGLSHEAVRLRLWAALVWLRHPAHSLVLRQLLECNSVAEHERADAAAQRYLRRRGGRQCPR